MCVLLGGEDSVVTQEVANGRGVERAGVEAVDASEGGVRLEVR